MPDVLTDDVSALVAAANATPEETIEAMEARAAERGFPHVGPGVGHLLRTLAVATGARRVFEFGSGFGYSAAWWAGALGADGDVVLTDYDESNLEAARGFLDDAYPATFSYEVGDALDAYDRHDGPWDAVLVDHEKSRYAEAFEAFRDDLTPGAVVVADNVMAGPVTPSGVHAALDASEASVEQGAGETALDASEASVEREATATADDDAPSDSAAGIAAYLRAVGDDPAFETAVVPLGEGVAVSAYRPREED